MDIGKIFSSALKYAFNGKRIAPFFIIYFLTASLILLSLHSIILNGISAIINVFWLIPVIIIVLLIKIVFDIVITENASHAWKGKEKGFNFSAAKQRFLSVLGASLVAGIIIVVLSLVPFIGFILSIVVSWFFLFIVPIIVISKKNAIESLKLSYRIFMKNKFDVFVFWILLSLISMVISLFAAVPLIISLMPIATAGIKGVVLSEAIRQNLSGIIISSIISILIISYVSVFDLAAKTFFYMQKKRLK